MQHLDKTIRSSSGPVSINGVVSYLKVTPRSSSFLSAEERLGVVGLGTPDSTELSDR